MILYIVRGHVNYEGEQMLGIYETLTLAKNRVYNYDPEEYGYFDKYDIIKVETNKAYNQYHNHEIVINDEVARKMMGYEIIREDEL